MKTRYVLGLAFWRNQVLLMHKKSGPPGVVGHLNGVGGKIEIEELPIEAMTREFMEETGVDTWPSAWTQRMTMGGEGYELNVFFNFLPDVTDFANIRNPENTGEILEWKSLDNLTGMVENLKWIIPMCMDSSTPYMIIREAELTGY